MTHEIVAGAGPEELLVRTSGAAGLEGLTELSRAVFAHPGFRPPLRILLDHSQLDWRELSADDIRTRAERILDEAKQLEGCRFAIVAPSPAGYGVVRMLWAHIEADASFELGIFVTVAEARAWLSEPSA